MSGQHHYCPACEVWSTDPACWICGQPGTRDPWRRPQRSWRDPADTEDHDL